MPTGYTAGIEDGTITDFPTFVMKCARAFGATITMRDDPMDAPIPDAFTPSNYHDEALARAKSNLAALWAMTPAEQDAAALGAHQHDMNGYLKEKERRRVVADRYNAMLLQVMQWEPPTPDHDELKKFMVQQINESTRHSTFDYPPPTPLTGAEWYASNIKAEINSIKYHEEHRREEIDRTDKRNAWVSALRESLSGVKA